MRGRLSVYVLVFLSLIPLGVKAVIEYDLFPPITQKIVNEFDVDMNSSSDVRFSGMRIAIGRDNSGIVRDPGNNQYLKDDHWGRVTINMMMQIIVYPKLIKTDREVL